MDKSLDLLFMVLTTNHFFNMVNNYYITLPNFHYFKKIKLTLRNKRPNKKLKKTTITTLN